MQSHEPPLKSTLFVVATPIGNLGDITQRAIDTLKTVDLIAAEDTRHSRRLLDQFGIQTKMISMHEHNEAQRTQLVIDTLKRGLTVALISDAGTPLISDPGYRLVTEVQSAGFRVEPIPGACALVAALSASGISTERFIFEGFLSSKSTERRRQLESLIHETRTIIFYESVHRITDSIADILDVFGKDRQAAICRELTKTFETIKRTSLGELNEWLHSDPNQQKGEFVIVVEGANAITDLNTLEAERILTLLLSELSLKKAVELAVAITGERKKVLYEKALIFTKGAF